MTKIIAFAGRKQSGKTTCSEFISNKYQSFGASKIYNFADPLKNDLCIGILGLTYDQCYGSDDYKNTLTDCYWDNKQMTAREVMQFIGTDVFRKMRNDVWTSATINRIHLDKPDLAIIADCRFPNEVEAIQNAGGLVIKLMRNPYNSDHLSETALDEQNYNIENFDLVVDNINMTIDEQNEYIYKFLLSKEVL